MKILLSLLLVSFALSLNAETVEEQVAGKYYKMMKNGNFSLAQQTMETFCKNYGKPCDSEKVMIEAFKQSVFNKDVASARFIGAMLAFAERDLLHKYPNTCAAAALTVGLTLGIGIGFYAATH